MALAEEASGRFIENLMKPIYIAVERLQPVTTRHRIVKPAPCRLDGLGIAGHSNTAESDLLILKANRIGPGMRSRCCGAVKDQFVKFTCPCRRSGDEN